MWGFQRRGLTPPGVFFEPRPTQVATHIIRELAQTPARGQSQQIQGSTTQLLSDLIDLAKRHPNARAVVQKYRISRNPNPATSQHPA